MPKSDVVLTFSADTGKAVRAIGKLDKAVIGLGKAFAGVQFAQFAAQLARVTKEAAFFGGELTRVADRAGLTTDIVQLLRIEGERFGATFEQVDEALVEFAKVTDDARDGAGELKDVYKGLGIELKDSEGEWKSVNVLLEEFSTALQGIEDSALRARLADQAFQGEGVLLGQGIARLNGTLKENADRLKEIGDVIDEDLIEQSAELERRWNEMTRSLSREFRGMTLDIIADAASMWATLQAQTRPGASGPLGWLMSLVWTDAELEEFFRRQEEQADRLAAALRGGGRGSSGGGTDFVYSGAGEEDGNEVIKERNLLMDENTLKLIENESAAFRLLDALKQEHLQLMNTAEAWRIATANKIAYAAGVHVTVSEAIMQEAEDINDLTKKISDEDLALKHIKRTAYEFSDVFGSAFADAISSGAQFGDVLKSLEQDLLNLITQLLVIRPLMNFIGTSLENSDKFAQVAALSQPKALGGPVSSGQTYLVGEKGPELFIPGSSGAIVPNSALSSINITINQTGGGGNYQSAQQLATLVGDRVNRAVMRNR